ncbi:MAG: hypothetical protein JXQ73_07625 [Phycisphaerae bacterium]|nr:hypothetical protein [Phycisphaerae bacterium]
MTMTKRTAETLHSPNASLPFAIAGVCAACTLSALVGCSDPAAEMNQIRQQFEQLGPKIDRGMVAFILGLPYAETKDHTAWLYFTPPRGPLDPARPKRMLVFRFDQKEQCISRELMLWRQPGPSQIELHYELSWTDSDRPMDNDLSDILHDKIKELARADDSAHLDSQPASFQFRVGQKLLVGMQRWQQGPSHLVRLTASVPGADCPRLTEAIDLSIRVRILSAGIEFDRPLMKELH